MLGCFAWWWTCRKQWVMKGSHKSNESQLSMTHINVSHTDDPSTYCNKKTYTPTQYRQCTPLYKQRSQVKVLAKSLLNVIPTRGMRREKDQTWGIITKLSSLSPLWKDRNKLTPPRWFTSCHIWREQSSLCSDLLCPHKYLFRGKNIWREIPWFYV